MSTASRTDPGSPCPVAPATAALSVECLAVHRVHIHGGRILFGWAHAVQMTDFTTQVLSGRHTVLAWEEIYEDGRYIFYRNREVAG